MSDRGGSHERRLDRSGFSLVFTDDFTEPELNGERWVAHYLPHWSTPERTAARYVIGQDGLRLLIEADQPAWRPEDGGMRASNIQTGTFSGPLGSFLGQHRHRPDLQVRTPQPTRRLWTPSSGLVEATVRASPNPECMVGIWLVGFEQDSPQQSGEVCIAELFGNAIGPGRSKVRVGIKAHHDPELQDDMTDVALDIDASEEHVYAAEWDARRARFFVDDVLVRTVNQGLDYPLQLMVDLFEFPDGDRRDPARYPKSAWVRRIRGYERVQGADVGAPTSSASRTDPSGRGGHADERAELDARRDRSRQAVPREQLHRISPCAVDTRDKRIRGAHCCQAPLVSTAARPAVSEGERSADRGSAVGVAAGTRPPHG